MQIAEYVAPSLVERDIGAFERVREQSFVIVTRHVDGTKGLKVFGRELGVEQTKSAFVQPVDQVHETDL